MKIVVDAMGGDNAPQEIVKGAAMALSKDKDLKVVLTGDEQKINKTLAGLTYDKARLEVINCTEVITNDDTPTLAIRQKKDSSLVVALKLLKEDEEVQGFVSAGSTGAVLTGALLRVGRIRGISRPAVCPMLPTATGGRVLIIDAGANAECKPVNLAHFAIMGTAYAKASGIANPRVGLVTNGTEEHKGDPLHQESYHLLKGLQGINFVGNVEGSHLFSGQVADVIVCDGFVGNTLLKTVEGLFRINKALKIPETPFWRDMNYEYVGGTPVLGVNAPVVIGHGCSSALAIKNMILTTERCAQTGVTAKLQNAFKN